MKKSTDLEKIKISVVIPFVNKLPTLLECLTALEDQQIEFCFEVIVVDRTKQLTIEDTSKTFTHVSLISLENPCGIPEMRFIGMSRAKGEFVAIIEDHCIVPAGWMREIVNAHNLGYLVIGGAVENICTKRLIDWAAFFCEYSTFMPPIPAGESDFITGNNTSFNRSLLEKTDDSLKKDYWEYFLLKELKLRNIKFLNVPNLIVNHKKEFGFFYFLKQRFYFSRSFASMRKRNSSFEKQVIYLLFAPFLPLFLVWKIALNVFEKKRNYREFFLSLPILLCFLFSYALGEIVGQLFDLGNSLLKIE